MITHKAENQAPDRSGDFIIAHKAENQASDCLSGLYGPSQSKQWVKCSRSTALHQVTLYCRKWQGVYQDDQLSKKMH
jgi:hypothetical protein